jgi:hypothetical protein
MKSEEWLRENFVSVFELPNAAVEWLLMLWDAIQVFDDVADGDEVKRNDLDVVIWNTLVGMSQNQFWQANANSLMPVVATMVLKWQASDEAERDGKADAKSYMWRAGYYDVVLMVVTLCHPAKRAKELSRYVMELYGEKFEDYMKEFDHA